jgi:uncharacterized coiled-coil DUF342 family protein
MTTDKEIKLLDDLQSLLEKQMELAQQGKAAGSQIETLNKQVDSLIEQIAQTGTLESPEFEKRRKQLQKLYGELCLAFTAAKDDTVERLSQLRKVRRTVGTYRNNI